MTLKKRKNKKKFLTLDAPHDVQLKGCDVNLNRKTGQKRGESRERKGINER